MPRGVAIPQLRQQLFAAAELVVVRDGPARLSSRAVTGEAGVATGLLHAHFGDLDEFLTAYAVDRSFLVSAAAAGLPDRAGHGEVAQNLAEALAVIPRTHLTVLARLMALRPELAGRVRTVLGDRAAGLDAIEQAATAYLTAERRLGRIAADADPAALALALVGVLHHLVLTEDTGERLRRAVTAVVKGAEAPLESRP
ncbi:TetR/AcrR family transcriptional regulator [Glycomyces harbinensis]|uniref:Transcriptional regulator, TetR family n=1 Tax=Glycomyces harbinensis TaxID=58114 RepID=A0A1G6ZSD3_9ACTN|nr:TetR/AcrR family transcriptional regulator [Glycomyces harbinensis]SDE05431.1 transcriptional regulator, TetR family [Glycomyces harbinensis]